MVNKTPAANPNQMVLGCSDELVQEGNFNPSDPEKRIALASVLKILGQNLKFGKEPSVAEYLQAEPTLLETGLFIHPTDPRYRQAQHMVTFSSYGVVFPPTEFRTIARSPRDLARHTVNVTVLKNLAEPDKEDTGRRSAGHALIAKMDSQKRLGATYNSERGAYRDVYLDLFQPVRTRYKAKNIEKRRALVDEKIHETAEVASLTFNLDTVVLSGIHRAIKKNLYSGNKSSSELAAQWIKYIKLLDKYSMAKLEKLRTSYAMSREELKIYQPFLDAKSQSEQTT